MYELKLLINNVNVTKYLTSLTWEGDNEQAGRKISFTLAYNTATKDTTFKNASVPLGAYVLVTYASKDLDLTAISTKNIKPAEYTIFKGRVFMASRDSSTFTKNYVAYDNLIYLAKSKVNKKFKNITVKAVLEQLANDFNLKIVLDDGIELNTVVDFIADNMTATEVIHKALALQTAQDQKQYTIIAATETDNIIIGSNYTEDVLSFKLKDNTNVINSTHSETLENMVNCVQILNDNGDIVGEVLSQGNIDSYGKITDSYKIDGKQNTEQQARAMLKTVEMNSSIEALGNIKCVSGKNIEIEEEQLKGKFFIKSDSHVFENDIHKMNLTVEFTKLKEDTKRMQQQAQLNKTSEYEKAIADAITKAQNSKNYNATNNTIQSAMDTAWQYYKGQTMPAGPNGCVQFAAGFGSWYSPFLKEQSNMGVSSVDGLYQNAINSGIPVIDFDKNQLTKGDIIIYGNNDHVVVYDKNNSYYGNSSSAKGGQGAAVHGSNYTTIGTPAKIIKTSKY